MSACPVECIQLGALRSHSSGREFAVLWPVAKPRGLSLMVWYLMVVLSVASPAGLRKNLQRKCGM